MPQMTNRRLVGEMAASPVGRGTVYNAMLKVSATNRERAAKVNYSEAQRLLKVNKVIDKDLRYSGWKSDQEIDKTKSSLKQLAAFQKVLKDEYPAQRFYGRSTHHTPEAPSSSTNMSGTTKNKSSTADMTSNQTAPDKKNPQGSNKRNLGKQLEYEGERSREAFDNHPVTNYSKTNAEVTETNYHTRVHFQNDKDHCVVENNSSLTSQYVNVRQGDVSLGKKTKSSYTRAATPIMPKGDKKLQISTQPTSSETFSKDKPATLPSSQGTKTDNKRNPESGRNSILEKLRQERRERITQRIYTRGFDMKTLEWDIQRQLKLMDKERARKTLIRQLIDESRENIDRVISENRVTFNTVVMAPKASPVTSPERKLSALVEEDAAPEVETEVRESSGAENDKSRQGNEQMLHTKTSENQSNISINPLLHKIPLF